jgi:hypothetical protein
MNPVTENSSNSIDDILMREQQQNKTETWTKLNRSAKIQCLHSYAERYGKDNKYSVKEIKQLKTYLTEAVDSKKFSKAKDVSYNRETQEVENIPGLVFNPIHKVFTLRTNTTNTLKSLTPKRFIDPKHTENT